VRALLAAAVLGLASTAVAQSAQDELERQLKDMVGKPPTKLHVEYEGLDQPNYKLVEISFTLDGQALPSPSSEKLNEGKTTIWHGDLKPGRHKLETSAVFTDVSGVLFSYEAGYKWTVKKSVGWDQQPGLEVHVLVSPEVNPSEKDPKKKFDLKSVAEVKMLAKLEDGTMPDAPKPNLAGGGSDVPDAGAAVAELSPAEKAKQAAADKAAAKKAADEEKKRQREEALAAKKAAAEEAKRKREDALAEKQRQREEGLAAKKAAAEEAKRQREEALAAKKAGTGEKVATAEKPEKPAEAPPQPEAAKAPEVVDAGAPAVAAAETPKPKEPPPAVTQPPASEDRSGMVPIIVGVAVALLGVVVFFATRRKKSPPQY
jgi:hypothetical protein